jgi:predicted phage tail protein
MLFLNVVPPRIDKDHVHKDKIWCRVGKSLKLENIDIEGEPAPTVTWSFKNYDQTKVENVTITNPEYLTSIVIEAAKRRQTGMYTIKAVNEHGEDEDEVEFVVLSPPGPPVGPLVISDVHKEGCKLAWNPPLDDGGCPIEAYLIEKMDTEDGKWVPCGRTDGDLNLNLEGLETGRKLRFRVKAVNSEGESEPLDGPEDPILIKDPFDPPGPPGLPEVIDWSENMVKLKWSPPLRENGAPVTTYTIEYREYGTDKWIVGPKVKAKKFPDGEVHDLEAGKKYEFRVRAENKAGLGEPSESTNPHFMKARFAPPKIDRSNLDTKVVKVNQQVVIEVEVTGEPAPETVWTINGEIIKTDGAVRTAHSPFHTKLMLIPAKRELCGTYKIMAKNSSGEDEAEVQLIIRGKPGPPVGPLKVFDITKNKCKLKWKPPLDDGGSPIEYYEIEKLDPTSGMWIPCGTSPTCEAEVKPLSEGKEYKFRVRAVNKDGESTDLATLEAIVAKNPFDPPAKPDPPIPLDWSNEFCDLKWKVPKDDGGSPITGYIMEIRDKDKRAWKEIDQKFKESDLTCKVEAPPLVEGNYYEFRVIAVNKAGPSEPSDPSTTIRAKVRFMKPRIDRSQLQKKVLHVDQLLRIDADYTGEPEPVITWMDPSGNLLKESERMMVEAGDYHTYLTVKKCQRSDTGIYKVTAKNDQGMDAADIDVSVLSAPGKPMGPIWVTNVTSSTCHLEWKPPKDDGGDPIKYYTVEKMDTEKDVWIPCGETVGKTPEFDVTGLHEGCTYMFRVRAVNNEGESEPLETDTAILAKNPFDPPGPPERLEVKDWDKKWVKLSYEAPSYDGGSRILHYIIEKKEDFSSKWSKHQQTDSDDLEVKVTDLTENSKYRFRVRAVNKAGPGAPSEPSEEVTCKTRNAPPVIDRNTLDDLRVKVGDPIKIDARISGEPMPVTVWSKDKTIMKSTPTVSVIHEDYRAKLVFVNAKRSDSATYSIKASNKNGVDEADISILVVGPPTSPLGPMKAEDIFADRCTLKWRLPQDDGGSPITHYTVEKMDLENGNWIPCGKTTDLQCTIEGLENMHEYMFRVKAVNSEGDSEPLEGTDPVLAKNPFDPPGPPGQPQLTDWDWDHFDLKWTEPRTDGGSRITSYIIEKRSANDDLWLKCAEIKPRMEFGAASDVELGKSYVFRIKAVNAAGAGPPGPESDTFVCRYKKLKPKIDRKSFREMTVSVGDVIDFSVPIHGEPPPDVNWSKDARSISDSTHRMIRIVDYHTSMRIDESTRNDDGVYMITAVNIHGKDAAEVRVNVVGRPGPPEGPLEIDDIYANGCKVTWKTPKDDGGLPIEGYIVEKLDVDTGIWSMVGTSTTLSIKCDTLEKGKQYEFRVKAFNSEGESTYLQSLKPITAKDPYTVPLPPSGPDIVDWSEKHMEMEWKEPLDDGGSAVFAYTVEKRNKTSMEWNLAYRQESIRCKGTATGLTEGEEYQFRAYAENKAGLSEPGQPSRWKEARPRFKPPKIERKQLKDMTVSAGEMIKLEGNIIGEPPPDVVWTKNEETLETTSSKSMIINNVPYNTKLIIRSCARSDAGEYTVLAKNSQGKDTVTINLTVLDKPDPPEDLKASDVHASGCTLKWRRPKYDGGCAIEYYQVEKFDVESGTWAPCGRATSTTLDVKGLTHMKAYKFRVTAVNEEGESLPCDGQDTIIAKNPFDVPGPPIDVTVADYDADSVTIKYQPPLNDGGSDITGYVIEKKGRFGDWERASEVPGSQLKATVINLTEGSTYEFRVRAVNLAGPGEPSSNAGPVTCKARNLPPKIDRHNFMEVRCNAGETFSFDVNVAGEPAPDKRWLSNSNEVTQSERIKITYSEHNTKFTVRKAIRKDTGTLTLTAENVNGTDSAEVIINVLDVPGVPMGPLMVKNMTAKDCMLEWKAPQDNGGLSISHYIVEKYDEDFGGRWTAAGETDGPEVTYKVENLTENHRYRFRVRAVNKQGKSEPLETAGLYEAKNPFEVPSKPGKPKVVDFDSTWAECEWSIPEFDGGSQITHYIIQKKDKYSNMWEKCGQTSDSNAIGKAMSLIEGTIYEFRVKAVNAAGESEPSDPSLPHKARAKNSVPKIDRHSMSEIRLIAGEPLVIDVPVEGEPPADKAWTKDGSTLESGIRLSLSRSDYQTVVRVSDTKRSDTGIYELVASNVNGTDKATCKVTVLDIPSPPEGPVSPKDIRKDSATISWNVPKDDGGSPITHYIIEKQDQGNMRWIPSGETRNLNYRVENLIEDQEYKFRIRAVNAQGESGPLIGPDPAMVAKDPYKVPGRPGKPHATNWSESHIELMWDPPKFDGGNTIRTWIIERKTKFGIWEYCMECNGPTPGCTVTEVEAGMEYQFRIIASNDAGKSEPGEPSDLICAEARYVTPWIDMSAMQDMVVCAGQSIGFNVPIKGAPQPNVFWRFQRVTIESSERLDIQV